MASKMIKVVCIFLFIIILIVIGIRNYNVGNQKYTDVPPVSMLIENEDRSYASGTEFFGIKWGEKYRSSIVTIYNESSGKTVKRLSLVFGASNTAVVFGKEFVVSGARGIKSEENIVDSARIAGLKNTFKVTINELFQNEGLVKFRVIFSDDEFRRGFFEIKYQYESDGTERMVSSKGKITRDKVGRKFLLTGKTEELKVSQTGKANYIKAQEELGRAIKEVEMPREQTVKKEIMTVEEAEVTVEPEEAEVTVEFEEVEVTVEPEEAKVTVEFE
ncbi:hypothetical protein ACFL0P_07010 [Candidatus Omnitrophota bacterium]